MFLSYDLIIFRWRSKYVNLKRYFNENTYVCLKTGKCEDIQDKKC